MNASSLTQELITHNGNHLNLLTEGFLIEHWQMCSKQIGLSEPESYVFEYVCVFEWNIHRVCCCRLVLNTVHIRIQPTWEMASCQRRLRVIHSRKSFRINMVVYIVHMWTVLSRSKLCYSSFFTLLSLFNISFIFECASVDFRVSKRCGFPLKLQFQEQLKTFFAEEVKESSIKCECDQVFCIHH